MTPLRIFIGYDSREPIAYHVLCHSILRHASGPVSFIPLVQEQLRTAGLYTRKREKIESTEFSMTRFLVPHLSGYQDFSLFLDCDMLVRGDVYDLLKIARIDRFNSVWCVQHDYMPSTDTKFLGQSQTVYPRKNWSSVMLFLNRYCDRLTPAYVNAATGIALHRMEWAMGDANIGMLPTEWNWLVGEYEKNDQAKILHYTLGGPWFRDYQHCDHAQLWFDELDRAMPSMNIPKPVGV
jgi:lipopolysaccharide biosynthesis glycosyltransferase